MHWFSVGILFLILCSKTQAQSTTAPSIKIHADQRISKLLEHRAHWVDSVGSYEGFRIQIFSSSGALSKTEAIEEKAKFMTTYPGTTSYLVSQMPYFKVRVGDFRSRLDALKFYHEIRTTYPNAFVVPDKIVINK